MSGHTNEWDRFNEKSPIRKETLTSDMEVLNAHLINDIEDAGQGALSAAKCFRTHWKMHEQYESFRLLNNAILEMAKQLPLASRTDEQGVPEEVPLKVLESWGLVYRKGESTDAHTHWPALWSYCYCVSACEDCVPITFPNMDTYWGGLNDNEVSHKTGQILLWPAWITHQVYEHECDHDRIVVAGNIYTDF